MKVPLLNFEGGPGILLLNLEGGPGVPLLNFRGLPGPTFKLWGGSRIPGPGVLVPLLHHALVLDIEITFRRQKPRFKILVKERKFVHPCKFFFPEMYFEPSNI